MSPLSPWSSKRQKLIEKVQEFRLIDDAFFNTCFNQAIACMEFILRIILNLPKLEVIEMHSQQEVPNLYSRSVRFDILAKDADGTEYDIEVQRNDEGASVRSCQFLQV